MSLADTVQPALDKKLPAALVAAFLLQTAGALFWAGQAAERIATLERTAAQDQSAIERVAVLEEDLRAMKESLVRIETKLDRGPDGKALRDPPTPLSWPATAGHPADIRSNL